MFCYFLPIGIIEHRLHMLKPKSEKPPCFGRISTAHELGKLIRTYRSSQQFTLERVAGITNIGMRFLSELERGKETAQLGKVIQIINQLGLEMIIQPRGFSEPIPQVLSCKKNGCLDE